MGRAKKKAHLQRMKQRARQEAKDAIGKAKDAAKEVSDIRASAAQLQKRCEGLEVYIDERKEAVGNLAELAETIHRDFMFRLKNLQAFSEALGRKFEVSPDVQDDFVHGHIMDLTQDNTRLRQRVADLEEENFELASKVSKLTAESLSAEDVPPKWLRRIERKVMEERSGIVDKNTIMDVCQRAIRWAKDYRLTHKGEHDGDTEDTEAERGATEDHPDATPTAEATQATAGV